ncbi:MAG TPA: ABC transporter ATP-binding protein [Pelovirga sp.]|nr:ABC transporter ATP-binding protein [Pelovirga sp.]
MIQANNLHFAFERTPIFNGLDLHIEHGEILSIIGPNGCGKSTLLRLLRGHLRPYTGDICWNNIPLTKMSFRNLARQVAMVPQTTHVDFPFTVHEMVAMGRYPHRQGLLSLAGNGDDKAIQEALALTDVLELAARQVTQLSGGELQRVLLARALAQNTPVLFLDEATSHLDIDHRLELAELLVRLNREQDKTIVQISHDLDLAAAISRRILMLSSHGEIVALGTPQQVMTATNLHRLFRVDLRVETNPYTGTPQITPLVNTAPHKLDHLKIHLFCGGGSGRILLRRLHLAQATLSVGPLNQGDSDHTTALALSIPTIEELPFQPYSAPILNQAREQITKADICVIATNWWGEGNLDCLDLALAALDLNKVVYLIDPQQKNDFTEGRAWRKIEKLQQQGAICFRNEEHLFEHLQAIQKS